MVGMAFEDLVAQFSPAALVILVTGRILGEPAAKHPHLLGDHLMDAPETGESESGENGGKNHILREQGKDTEDNPRRTEDHPAFPTPVIFHLNRDWVADSYYEEDRHAHYYSIEIHLFVFNIF